MGNPALLYYKQRILQQGLLLRSVASGIRLRCGADIYLPAPQKPISCKMLLLFRIYRRCCGAVYGMAAQHAFRAPVLGLFRRIFKSGRICLPVLRYRFCPCGNCLRLFCSSFPFKTLAAAFCQNTQKLHRIPACACRNRYCSLLNLPQQRAGHYFLIPQIVFPQFLFFPFNLFQKLP